MEAFRLHIFRVEEGLGNACAVELPDGRWGVIDWGTEKQEPLEKLLALAQETGFHFVVASHAHADHTLGLPQLFETCAAREISVDRFYYPASTLNKPTSDLQAARHKAKELKIRQSVLGVRRRPPEFLPTPDLIAAEKFGAWSLAVLAPEDADVAEAELRAEGRGEVPGNETSLVVLAAFRDTSSRPWLGRALLPGDATPTTFRRARQLSKHFPELALHNQALLVPHHGSQRNLPNWFLEYLHGVALVSAPTNSAHHPGRKTLATLRSRSLTLFCTSYAHCCRKAFRANALLEEQELVASGPCFGDIVVRVPKSAAAMLEHSSRDGERRRRFGYCGAPTELIGLGGARG